MQTSVAERIKILMSELGENQNSFSKKIGVTPSTIATAFERNKGVNTDLIQKIINVFTNISLEWLLTGRGEPIKKNAENNNNSISVISQTKSERKLIPYFDAVAEAGSLSVANMEGISYPAEMVDAGDFFQDATAIMQVHGESMFPDYKPGSLVALKEVYNKRLIIYGEDYVIETTEYRVIKKIQQSEDKTCWLACSTNTEIWEQGQLKGRLIHEPFDVPIDEVRRLYLVLGEIYRKHSNRIIQSNS